MTSDRSKVRQFLASVGGAGLGLLVTASHAQAEATRWRKSPALRPSSAWRTCSW